MVIKTLVLLMVLGLSSGCTETRGLAYTRVIVPYSTDFNNTSVGSKKVIIVAEHHVQEPLSGQGISASWTAQLIAEEAKAAGMTNVSFADLEILSVVDETYRRQKLLVYGD